jgi:hypothetical protein
VAACSPAIWWQCVGRLAQGCQTGFVRMFQGSSYAEAQVIAFTRNIRKLFATQCFSALCEMETEGGLALQ